MYFEQFCKETKKIELSLLSKVAREIEGEYVLTPASAKSEVVRGFHIPNDSELLDLWNIMAPQTDNDYFKNKDKIKVRGENSYLETFVNNIKKSFHIDFMDTGNFDETFARIKYKWQNKNVKVINSKELVALFEELYLKTNSSLLDNDIRIRALNLNPSTNLIMEFNQANKVWYEGKPYIGTNVRSN